MIINNNKIYLCIYFLILYCISIILVNKLNPIINLKSN